MTTTATLAGLPLLAAKEIAWPQRAGVDPVVGSFSVMPDQLPHFLAFAVSQAPVDLVVDYGAGTHTVKGLYVIREEPDSNPHVKRIVVADRRRFWRTAHIVRRFNMRRRVGSARRGQWNAQLQPDVVPELQFARYSLKKGVAWKADEVILNILVALGEAGANVDTTDLARLPVENLVLDDRGDLALRRCLELMPGARVTLTPSGVVQVFSALTGAEQGVVGTGEIGEGGLAGPELVGMGHVELVSDHADRPKSVFVGFTIEAEIRIDCVVGNEDVGTTDVAADPDDPPLEAVNVIQVPDFEIEVGGTTVYQGTYVPFRLYLAAISANRGTIREINDELLRIIMVPGMGMAPDLQLLGEHDISGDLVDWPLRISALMRDYRTLYRIERHLMDRILSLQDYLVATIDLTSGQRAPAAAFGDYTIIWSKKENMVTVARGDVPNYHSDIKGYPGALGDFTAATARPSHAKIHVVDSDQGIVRIEYQIPPYGFVEAILPSRLVSGPARSFGIDDPRTCAFNVIGPDGGIPQLAAEHRVAIVLSAVPAAPNDIRQLYWIEVPPGDVRDLLPEGAAKGLDNAFGPSVFVRVPPAVETARVRWQQSKRDYIRAIFGIGGLFVNDRAFLGDLVINDAEQNVIGASAASLRAIARATAAAVYARYPVRVMGARSAPFDVNYPLVGQIEEITHTVGVDGSAITALALSPETFPLDMWSFLDSGTRQVIGKMIVGPYKMGG